MKKRAKSKMSFGLNSGGAHMNMVESYFKGMYDRQDLDHSVEDAQLATLTGIFGTQKEVVNTERSQSADMKKVLKKNW